MKGTGSVLTFLHPCYTLLMARSPQIEFLGVLYHFTSHSDRREDTYLDNDNLDIWVFELERPCSQFNWVAYAFYQTTNHYHLGRLYRPKYSHLRPRKRQDSLRCIPTSAALTSGSPPSKDGKNNLSTRSASTSFCATSYP